VARTAPLCGLSPRGGRVRAAFTSCCRVPNALTGARGYADTASDFPFGGGPWVAANPATTGPRGSKLRAHLPASTAKPQPKPLRKSGHEVLTPIVRAFGKLRFRRSGPRRRDPNH